MRNSESGCARNLLRELTTFSFFSSPEVCEVSLDVQVQDGSRSGGAQRRTVLAQQVLELLTDLPDGDEGGREGLPSVYSTLFSYCTHLHHFGSNHTWIQFISSQQTAHERIHAGERQVHCQKTSKSTFTTWYQKVCWCRAEATWLSSPGCLYGFVSELKSLLGWLYRKEINLSWKQCALLSAHSKCNSTIFCSARHL